MTRVLIAALMLLSLLTMVAGAAEVTGYVSEAKCAAAHADGSEKSVKCVTGCVKKGSAPVLVSDGKVLKIADASKVMDHLGKKVTINGKVDGDTVTINSIKAAD